MLDTFRYRIRLILAYLDRATPQIQQEFPGYHIEELVFVIMMMPMELAFEDPQPHEGIVHSTQVHVAPFL